ncbi:hypothetical protein H5T89_01035 [bacterium]|nr:hypothetical protein [bacterium]
MLQMNEKEYARFMKALDRWNEKYDPDVCMVKEPFHSPGYHTTLKGGWVHPTRSSLTYAVALLDSGIEDYRLRAIDILRKVISLQDQNPSSPTYGIWSWFYEEPLEKMSPPDWNWANFCGKELLQVALDHFDRIPEDLRRKIKDSIYHACRSIIRRNVGPSYTNIAIMGAYVTLLAGELFGWKDIFDYGKDLLRRIYEYTKYHGAFTEYNSPTYTMVAIEDISRILSHIKDKDSLEMAEYLNDVAWRCVALHFHPPTGQWAGPHSRCYNNIQGVTLWSRIQLATEGKVRFLDEEELYTDINWHRIKMKCPDSYIDYFIVLDEPRFIREVFYKGDKSLSPELRSIIGIPFYPTLTATTYLSTSYCVGTFSKADFWNQRRGFIGYLGSRNNSTYLQLRCLHDGYDYSSGLLHTVQLENRILGIVNFATDYGDTHISLDKVKDATIRAKDLRLRLEFGGYIDKINLPYSSNLDDTIITYLDSVKLGVKFPRVSFGNYTVKLEIDGNDKNKWIDIVFYSGEERPICFRDLERAFAVFAFYITEKDNNLIDKFSNIEVNEKEEKILVRWAVDGNNLEIEADLKPDSITKLLRGSKGLINGIPIEKEG